jgi:predicted DNA-binding protein
MSTQSLPTYGIPIRVPPKLRDRLRAEKEATGLSVNAIVNEVLSKHFERVDVDVERKYHDDLP